MPSWRTRVERYQEAVAPLTERMYSGVRNRSTDATRGLRLPSADPGGSLRDAAGDPDPLGPELRRSVARDKVDLRPARTGVRWRRGGSSQPRGEDAPRHAPRKLSSANYERVTNRAAVNTSDSWTPGQAISGHAQVANGQLELFDLGYLGSGVLGVGRA
jgi:hypothetical protein